jgi:hypothetical protein
MIIMPTQQPTTNMASANAVDPHMMGSISFLTLPSG